MGASKRSPEEPSYGDLNNLVPTLSKISPLAAQPFLIKVINTAPLSGLGDLPNHKICLSAHSRLQAEQSPLTFDF